MAKVIFADEGTEIEVPDGSRLQDVIEEAEADIPFGCREGECATCIVEVISGGEFLGEPSEEERLTLMKDELERGIRLACQCKVSGGAVSLRPAEDNF